MATCVALWIGESSNIGSYKYYDDSTLYVFYKKSLKVYAYSGVPKETINDLEHAESKGTFINQYIVKVFTGEVVKQMP